ncbi:MAG: phosphotriesterase family protein [Blautia sp.]|jgi:predicted metal-dependent phosphotriesterase family hydrolase
MKTITTVLGRQNPEDLGFCHCHEHLMISKGVSFEQNPVLCMEDVYKSTQEVIRFREAGGGTIIDAQPGGCNRMECALHSIAEASGVNIIASTGFHKLIFYPEDHWMRTAEEGFLYDFFLHELQNGMYTNIDREFHSDCVPYCAGIVKTALDVEGLTPVYKKLFTAAAKASITADVPLMVHIEDGSDPAGLLAFLLDLGVPAKRILFCHMDRSVKELSYYTQVLDQGITLEFDTIGRFKYHDDRSEVQLFLDLMAHGYESQLLFSLDTTAARLKTYTPDAIGLDYILNSFVPALKAAGATDEQIHMISHDNCIHVFTD